MPKLPIDYSKTIIYKIICCDPNVKDCYVGHTIDFTRRKSQHKSSCNNLNSIYHNFKVYETIRENGNWENWQMIKIEEFSCKNRLEAKKRERECLEELQANLNVKIPNRTSKEYYEDNKTDLIEKSKKYYEMHKTERSDKCKIYYENHKTDIIEKSKEYSEKHKTKIKKYQTEYYEEKKERIECPHCNLSLNKRSLKKHISKKHTPSQ